MNCEQLEDYLCRLLDADASAEFEGHTNSCDACAAAVEADRSLMRLLRTASRSLESPRVTLHVPSIPSTASQPSRRSAAFAVATCLCALMLILATAFRATTTKSAPTVSDVERPASSVEIPPPSVQLAAGQTGIPIESHDPNIRILLVSFDPVESELMVPKTPAAFK